MADDYAETNRMLRDLHLARHGVEPPPPPSTVPANKAAAPIAAAGRLRSISEFGFRAAPPTSFIESALSTRVEYEASLKLRPYPRCVLEEAAAKGNPLVSKPPIDALGRVVVPHGITIIPEDAFYNDGQLVTVELPEGIVEIGRRAFAGCHSLTTVNLPASLTSIGEATFYKCRNLDAQTRRPSRRSTTHRPLGKRSCLSTGNRTTRTTPYDMSSRAF